MNFIDDSFRTHPSLIGITFKGVEDVHVFYRPITYLVSEIVVKAKQWAFGLRPIHLSRAFESEAAERGEKNGKQRDPHSVASPAKRDIAKKLIPRLTVCEPLHDLQFADFAIRNKLSSHKPRRYY